MEIRDDKVYDWGPDGPPLHISVNREGQAENDQDRAWKFMVDCGLDPTPDAADQLAEVFLPCLRIMCERGYDPNGANWREGGWRSQLVDTRKKFKRLWFHAWIKGKFVPDHGFDMINYIGFYQRLKLSGEPWGDWGEPEDNAG
jgi:hypothetical protein